MDAYDWHALFMLALPLEVVLALGIAGRRPLPRGRWWGPTLAAWGFLSFAFVLPSSGVCACGHSGEREMRLGLACACTVACLVRRWRGHFCLVLWFCTTLLAHQAVNLSHGLRWPRDPVRGLELAQRFSPKTTLHEALDGSRAWLGHHDETLTAGWLVECPVLRPDGWLSRCVDDAHANARRLDIEMCWHTWLTGHWRIVERERIAPWFTGGRAADIPDRIEWRRWP